MATLSEIVKGQAKAKEPEVQVQEWEAQDAAHILKRASEISNNKALIKAAKACLRKEAKALEKALKKS